MGEVKNIADANFGISPQLLRHVEQFEAEIWESMADATKAGVPICILIGIMTIAQQEIINVGINISDDDADS